MLKYLRTADPRIVRAICSLSLSLSLSRSRSLSRPQCAHGQQIYDTFMAGGEAGDAIDRPGNVPRLECLQNLGLQSARCLFKCVCVRERDREREGARACVYACVCVRVRAREFVWGGAISTREFVSQSMHTPSCPHACNAVAVLLADRAWLVSSKRKASAGRARRKEMHICARAEETRVRATAGEKGAKRTRRAGGGCAPRAEQARTRAGAGERERSLSGLRPAPPSGRLHHHSAQTLAPQRTRTCAQRAPGKAGGCEGADVAQENDRTRA